MFYHLSKNRVNKPFYLASQSKSRQALLKLAQISYHTIPHKSDECGIDPAKSFNDYVLAIAKHKMEHVDLTSVHDAKEIYILTADTLMQTATTKKILGKPKDIDDAKRMLGLLRQEKIELATGCCLDKKVYDGSCWKTIDQQHWVTPATLEFSVEEELVDLYLEKMPHALHACGSGAIEDFGLNFLKQIDGSFTTIMGLPLFELRQALKKIGFFS